MNITRRKSQIYPVALVFAFLCIASSARAQLCLTTEERSCQPILTGKTNNVLSMERKLTLQELKITQLPLPANIALPQTPVINLPEIIINLHTPATTSFKNEQAAAARPPDDFLKKFMIAALQPLQVGTWSQTEFVE